MSKKWFTGVSTITELKVKYRELARKYHPDASKSDTNKEMAEINNEYEYLFGILPKTEKERKEGASILDGYREIINAIIKLDGLQIELIGSWLWVTGETKKHKEELKKAGFIWAKKKIAWFWRPAECKSYNRRQYNLDEIRGMHGSQILASNPKATFQAIPANN